MYVKPTRVPTAAVGCSVDQGAFGGLICGLPNGSFFTEFGENPLAFFVSSGCPASGLLERGDSLRLFHNPPRAVSVLAIQAEGFFQLIVTQPTAVPRVVERPEKA